MSDDKIAYRDAFPKHYDVKALARMQDRNEVLEEVARAFEKMKGFGDTAHSFAIFVRNMKQT